MPVTLIHPSAIGRRMIDRNAINFVHWQKRLVAENGDMLGGEIVTDFADIEQEISILINTMIGSVPTNPLKGCDIYPLIDLPSEEATPLICQKIWDAITAWITRIEIGSVHATPLEVHHWKVLISWRPKNDVLAAFKTFDLNLKLGHGGIYAN